MVKKKGWGGGGGGGCRVKEGERERGKNKNKNIREIERARQVVSARLVLYTEDRRRVWGLGVCGKKIDVDRRISVSCGGKT